MIAIFSASQQNFELVESTFKRLTDDSADSNWWKLQMIWLIVNQIDYSFNGSYNHWYPVGNFSRFTKIQYRRIKQNVWLTIWDKPRSSIGWFKPLSSLGQVLTTAYTNQDILALIFRHRPPILVQALANDKFPPG